MYNNAHMNPHPESDMMLCNISLRFVLVKRGAGLLVHPEGLEDLNMFGV